MASAKQSPGDVGSGRPLEAFRDDARLLPAADFEVRHGSGFLLLSSLPTRSARDTFSTHLAFLDEPDAQTGALATLVYPLQSAHHILSIGRARDNDVVIPDRSISRRHAFLKRVEGSRFLVLDAGSSNGTSVNGANVLTRGSGPPTPLGPGDTLRLGQLDFTFAHAAGLREFAAKLR